MRNFIPATGMETRGASSKAILQSVTIKSKVNNLLCETAVYQTYKNTEECNIEAIFTFPLPLDAVLLNFKVKLNDRKLTGTVSSKSDAEELYEEAISEGDAAIMLEQCSPGLFTVNIGNLLPGETAEVQFIYSELFKWQQDSIRFFLPTTIAPRYGNPEQEGLEPHQVPENELLAENRFSFSMNISGILAGAAFKSPSHKISARKNKKSTTITIKDQSCLMDRDFVLNIQNKVKDKNFALIGKDIDSYTSLVSFNPVLPKVKHMSPRNIKVVVDCSGSMSGDSILQAKKALTKLTTLLSKKDYFNIIAFGTNQLILFHEQKQATEENIEEAADFINNLDANMGGTRMKEALACVYQSSINNEIPPDILLITDGEVWKHQDVIQDAKRSGHRIFTFGVGSSVSESLIRDLAKTTNGACELAAPNEDMSEKIIRHFKRIYTPADQNIFITWPNKIEKNSATAVKHIFSGDTLYVFAKSKKSPSGEVKLSVCQQGKEIFAEAIPLAAPKNLHKDKCRPGTIARMRAAEFVSNLEESDNNRQKTAIEYQLMSRFTNYIIVEERSNKEKAKDLPKLRKVKHIVPAGHGGMGSVMCSVSPAEMRSEAFSLSRSNISHRKRSRLLRAPDFTSSVMESSNEFYSQEQAYNLPQHFTKSIDLYFSGDTGLEKENPSFEDLKQMGLPKKYIAMLSKLLKNDKQEKEIIAAFLFFLAIRFNDLLTRQTKRAISFQEKKSKLGKNTSKKLLKEMKSL